MNSFALTRQAKSDLKAIARFTEKTWRKSRRNIYIKQFDDTFHLLADTPEVGKNCSFIKRNYQKSPQGSHLIFYNSITVSSIEIIRILHKNMDVISKFDNS